jgi:tRNA(Arg) A34 adenosine deaminase TadA
MVIMDLPRLELHLPAWVDAEMSRDVAGDDAARMRFVIDLARENVKRRTGGPFAAAVYESGGGPLVAIGLNLVPSLGMSVLHAEVVAIMAAQRRTGSFTLSGEGMPRHELVTSCEPCAMCFGAILWSGVRRLVCGATKADAEALGFDEGPVTEASYRYMADRGIEVVRGIESITAQQVLSLYAESGGVIYNG